MRLERLGISNPMVLGPPIPPCQMKEFTALRITSGEWGAPRRAADARRIAPRPPDAPVDPDRPARLPGEHASRNIAEATAWPNNWPARPALSWSWSRARMRSTRRWPTTIPELLTNTARLPRPCDDNPSSTSTRRPCTDETQRRRTVLCRTGRPGQRWWSMIRSILATLLLTTPALALDEPVPWRDPDSGCAYWLTPQGGIAPRFRRDGTPDCPEADIPTRAIAPPGPIIRGQAVRDAVTGLGRGLDALKREVERFAESDQAAVRSPGYRCVGGQVLSACSTSMSRNNPIRMALRAQMAHPHEYTFADSAAATARTTSDWEYPHPICGDSSAVP